MNDEGKERKGMRRILTSLIHCFIILTAFYTLYYLSYTVFTFYLFIWTADNNYLYLWIIAILLVILKKPFAAYSITAGNIAGRDNRSISGRLYTCDPVSKDHRHNVS